MSGVSKKMRKMEHWEVVTLLLILYDFVAIIVSYMAVLSLTNGGWTDTWLSYWDNYNNECEIKNIGDSMREKARDTKMFTHDIPLRLIKVLDIICDMYPESWTHIYMN